MSSLATDVPGRPFSLARYLLVRLLLFVLPIVVAGLTVQWAFQRELLTAQFDEMLAEKARTLATLVTRRSNRLELEFADEFMPEYSRAERPFYFEIFDPDGRSIERSYSLGGDRLPFLAGEPAAPFGSETRLAAGVDVRCVGIEFPVRLEHGFDEDARSSVVVVVGARTAELGAALGRGLREVAGTGLVLVVGIAAFVTLVLRRGSRLITRAVLEVERIRPDALEPSSAGARAPEELRPILDALSRSMRTVRRHVERERRFTADVAHELRTPIAELRAASDIALRWQDPDSCRQLARDANEIALQMGALVESLLELAVLESDAPPGRIEDVDLASLVAQAVEQARRGGGERPEIDLDSPARLVVATQRPLWELVLRNLLDNARAHSPPGSRIAVSLAADGDGARLSVSNPAGSLDEEDVARCTERLWRGSRDPADARHFGLGLSIVQAASVRLGRRLTVRLVGGRFEAILHGSEVDAPERRR